MSGLDLSLREQAAAIARGDLDPRELLDACLARIEERSELNAIVETFPDQAAAMLAAAPDGPLRGVPVAIKDEWPLPWRAERLGAAWALDSFSPGESGPYLALRDAGAVIVGIANMHELGSGTTGAESVYGAAHNPWALERCTGGSSSGSAAAVAGGLLAGAIGADGAGSIRIPAAYCGLTGLKPTFGRSAMAGHHLAEVTETIVSGALCADAADSRLLSSVMFGEELRAGEPGALRIGVLREPFWNDCTDGVRAACESGLGDLIGAGGGELVELGAIAGIELSGIAAALLLLSEDAAGLTPQALAGVSPELGALNRAILKYRMLVPATLVARAGVARTLLRRSFAAAFENVDLIAWPTSAAPAPLIENPTVELPGGLQTADAANTRQCGFGNVTGLPAISVPVGLDQGLPVGLQLIAPWGSDELLLDAAEALEGATDRRHVEAEPALTS